MMTPLPVLGFAGMIIWGIVKLFLYAAITTGIGYLMARNQKSGMKAAGINEFKYPTAEEGRPLMVVWGKRRVISCNAICAPFHLRIYKKKRHDSVVAFKYHIGLHLQICHAADGVKQLWMGGKCVWPTANDPTDEAADATVSGYIDADKIFGGHHREGGVKGDISIQYGGSAQTRSAYLTTHLGDGPAFRGMVGVIWEQVYVGTSPYIKPMSMLVKRTDILCDRTAMWYIAKANVGDDHCNPIHVVYEMLTSTIVGCGKDTSLIGDSFADAADTCYDEGYGLDIVWDSAPDDVQSMIDKICQIIDGVLYQDLSTGKFEIALVRDDYNPAALDTYDDSYFWVENYECPSVAKAPAKTFVHFHDRGSTKKRPAYDDDIAILEMQGSNPVTQEFDFSGFITDETLANTIAAREQRVASAMPKYLTLNCDRRMADLAKGAVIKITYPDLQISGMIVRVLDPEYGSLKDGRVRLFVVEDVFGQAYTAYGAPTIWANAEGSTDPIVNIDVYYDAATTTVTWDDGEIIWNGVVYEIDADTTGTTDQYIWFDYAISETVLQHGASSPSASTAVLIWENTGGALTENYPITVETTTTQTVLLTENWRLREDAAEKLYLEHESGGAWTEEAEFEEE